MRDRYSVARGGEGEPGLILVIDEVLGLIHLRGSEISLQHIQQLVKLANSSWQAEQRPVDSPNDPEPVTCPVCQRKTIWPGTCDPKTGEHRPRPKHAGDCSSNRRWPCDCTVAATGNLHGCSHFVSKNGVGPFSFCANCGYHESEHGT